MPETSGPAEKNEGSETARAFERAYRETHPDGPYPAAELKTRKRQ